MKISKKAEYALCAVVAIARAQTTNPVPIQELAETEQIPVKFLEQILLSLKNAGILVSKRGVGGGYQLSRPAAQISAQELISLIDGPFSPWSDTGASSPGLVQMFEELKGSVDTILERHSVQDILQMEKDQGTMAFDI